MGCRRPISYNWVFCCGALDTSCSGHSLRIPVAYTGIGAVTLPRPRGWLRDGGGRWDELGRGRRRWGGEERV